MEDECTDLSKEELLTILQMKQREIDYLETACKGYEKIIAEYKRKISLCEINQSMESM